MDAWEQARRFANDGCERVIAVGGDGTFNEVMNGLMEADNPTPMGIVPAGTGCDLPRSLGLTGMPIEEAVRRAATGMPTIVDVGRVECGGESRFFINVAGLGFDATVAERAARTKLPSGKISYLSALATSLASYRNIPVAITCNGRSVETRAVFVTVANARFFGGGFNITPMASLTDGLLDVAIVGDLSIAELLANIPSVYRGTHTNHPKFTHMTATSVRVESSIPALVQADGELMGRAPAEFTVHPSSMAVIV
jgi:YegS/Rv2252/BmrU family lipid kinase